MSGEIISGKISGEIQCLVVHDVAGLFLTPVTNSVSWTDNAIML